MTNSSIQPIDTFQVLPLRQSAPGNNGSEGVLRIPQIYSITGASLWDSLKHSFGESYPPAETQSAYTTAPANWAMKPFERF